MAKSLDLYLSYANIVESIATKPNLFGLLLDIGENYEPRQQESLVTLLGAAADMSQVFLDVADPGVAEEVELKKTKSMQEEHSKVSNEPSKLAERLVEVN